MQVAGRRPTDDGNRGPVAVARWIARLSTLIAVFGLARPSSAAQTMSLTERIANGVIERQAGAQSNSRFPIEGNEDESILLEGMGAGWYNTSNGDYFRYLRQTVDAYLATGATIPVERPYANSVVNALLARQTLLLYRVTLDPKYYRAALAFREQFASVCGLASAKTPAFQTKQERSGDVCMAGPFLAEFASVFQERQDFAGITIGFEQWDKENNRQPKAVKDESSRRSQAQYKAWEAVALVDSLPYYPRDDPGRKELIAILDRLAVMATQRQNPGAGSHYEAPKAYAESYETDSSSSSSLYVYAVLKGIRLGYLPARYSAKAKRIWRRAEERSVPGTNEATPFTGNSGPTGDLSAANELNGDGASLLAATEVDLAPTGALAHGETVMLDAWYNSQQRRNAAGQLEYFHYKWSDFSDSGYSLLAHMLRSYGATTDMLYSAPTQERLSQAQFYIIVSPDIPSKNPSPHYMTAQDAEEIADWVKQGGVLILMENDPPNADITHMNLLADQFGIHFDDVLHHHILGEKVEDGRIPIVPGGPLFHQAHTLYMKDTCAITLRDSAVALLRDRGDVVMAESKYGRGTVFAAVDPWLYNEYTDGRKNPRIYGQFDNFAGGKELVQWLLRQRPKNGRETRKRRELEP
jgi:unsaturated rhamnogalacturonyl hydrolase